MLCFLILGFAVAGATPAGAVSLRDKAVIQDSTLKLSDIFQGLSEHEDRVLGPAPRPGSDMTLNARTLLRIAQALDLPWRPENSGAYIIVSRAATIIDQDMIKDALGAHIREENKALGAFEISFMSDYTEIILPENTPAQCDVTALNFNAATGRFDATLAVPSKDNPLEKIRLSGRIHTLIKLPVLKESLRSQTRIGAGDIDFITLRGDYVPRDAIVDSHDLVGMIPRHIVKAGEIIKTGDIIMPDLVARGQSVTMIYKNGALRLTALGKALENGTKGAMVRVVNTASSRTVEAVVTGEQEVTIQEF